MLPWVLNLPKRPVRYSRNRNIISKGIGDQGFFGRHPGAKIQIRSRNYSPRGGCAARAFRRIDGSVFNQLLENISAIAAVKLEKHHGLVTLFKKFSEQKSGSGVLKILAQEVQLPF